MNEVWSRAEVEATVADYFDMLGNELKGQQYNKAEHRRFLTRLLNSRSDSSIEYKHQNISAILLALGVPSINGYKPASNYQKLLYDVILSRLAVSKSLQEMLKAQVAQPALVPAIENILNVLVPPPSPARLKKFEQFKIKETAARYTEDFIAQEARNTSLGTAGEEFVVLYEKAYLQHEGRDDLASKVEHVAKTQGDKAGFDILSFDAEGHERFIEVKTTRYNEYTPFFASEHEVAFSRRTAAKYHLCRAFNFRRSPRLFTKSGPLDANFILHPVEYIANLV